MSFSPSPAELSLTAQIFEKCDPQKLGIVTGDQAVKVFTGANLPPTTLGEIWNLADEDNKGWLPKRGVAIAVRLIGWAQRGEKVSKDLINKPGPLPTIDGFTAPVIQHNTGTSLGGSGIPELTPADRQKFLRLFQGCGPENGILSGDKARDVFIKSKLPNEKLGQIWNLADSQDRGALDATDFAIGMYLIQACMSGQLTTIPPVLPPKLYDQAQGTARSPAPGPRLPARPSNFGGAAQTGYTSPTRRQSFLPPQSPAFSASPFGNPQTQKPWDVTAAEKTSSDVFFNTLDTSRNGYIEGDVAVPFMLESNLSGDILAHVWDLADINNDGRLTRDGFAVAMHLIQGKLAGKPIPDELPASLIPPSMRQTTSEPVRDLFDDTPPSSATPSGGFMQAQMTGGNVMQPQATGGTFMKPHTTGGYMQPQQTGGGLMQPQQTGGSNYMTPQQTGQRALQPQGTGGRMQPQYTGQSPYMQSPPQQQPSAFVPPSQPQSDPFGHDLMGDEDDVDRSPPLQDKSAEIGNTQNQLSSTNRSLETAKAERAALQQTLENQVGQLSALQTQLASSKVAYETETKLLETLRERHATQTTDIQNTREQLIRAESDLSAVRVEKTEIEGAFLRDKEEARDLHRRMIEAGQEAESLKLSVEKAKKEAKQQRGLLAIAKKQLSSKEAERAKVQKELEEAEVEVGDATKERGDTEAELSKLAMVVPLPTSMPNSPRPETPTRADTLSFAAAVELPTSEGSTPVGAGVASPGSVKSNNPFERLAFASNPSTPRSQSPFSPSMAHAETTFMPAESPVVSSPPHDPFGFSQFQGDAEPEIQAPIPTVAGAALDPSSDSVARSSPSPLNIIPGPSDGPLSAVSTAETEMFSTPPSTATHGLFSPAVNGSNPTQFPPIEQISHSKEDSNNFSIPGGFPGAFPEDSHETDLDAPLKDLEVTESDSDSDSDDDVPLAQVKESKGKEVANGEQGANSFEDMFGASSEVTPTTKTEHLPSTTTQLTAASAHDAFGAPTSSGGSFNAASSPFAPDPVAVALPTPQPTVAGVNAFDEAMGSIPSPSSSAMTTQFSFDSAFDDNFDFASAGGNANPATSNAGSAFPAVGSSFPTAGGSFPPASPSVTNGDGSAVTSPSPGFDSIFSAPSSSTNGNGKPSENSTSFDDAFGGGNTAVPQSSNVPAASFDETFAGFGTTPALQLTPTPATPERTPEITKSFPVVSPPTSPKTGTVSSRLSSVRTMSPPPRDRTPPPPRVSSPKPPRTSTSSSKESHDKPKDAPRLSKLSIRLPFGRKKKPQVEAVPPPPTLSHLTPPIEEPSGHQTPAMEDDIDAVKQLCGMGFSRTQAVNALEKHAYDVQKALNSLLGAS